MKTIISIILIFNFCVPVSAQREVLTNNEIILMTRAGLSNELIIRKIKDSGGNYDTKTQALIDLKKAGVSDEIIKLMMNFENENKSDSQNNNDFSDSNNPPDIIYPNQITKPDPSRIVLDKDEALRNAKTIAIKKSSLHPARQALEKELLKRADWQKLNLNIVRYKDDADLYIEIGYVSLSWITHRYVYRIYESKSGTVIAAGETTSWGDLAENLARGISKRLAKALDEIK